MTIFYANLKRIFRKRSNRLLIFLLPIALVFVFFKLISVSNGNVAVRIVDNDNTKFTQGIKNEVNCKFVSMSESQIKTAIATDVDYVVVIDKGFTDKLINGEDVKLTTYNAEGANYDSGAQLSIENYIDAGKNIAKCSNKDSNKFYAMLTQYKKGNMTVKEKLFSNEKSDGIHEKYSLDFVSYSLLLLAGISCYIIMADKKNNTLVRMLASPLDSKSYLIQNILSYFVVMAIQIIITLYAIIYMVGGDIGPSFTNMFIIFSVFSLCAIGLNLAICSISKNAKQASTLSSFINTLLAMLGGAFWPREVMPSFLRTAGNFTPTAWLVDGISKLLVSPDLSSVYQNIGILLLFTVVFFLFCSWKKVYVEDM